MSFKHYIFVSLVFILPLLSRAQNLVPNGSFEAISSCPTAGGQLNYAYGWFQPNKFNNSSDLFNSCANVLSGFNVPHAGLGYQNAVSGNGFCGIALYEKTFMDIPYREYIEAKLKTTLEKDSCYKVSMFISLANLSMYSLNFIHAKFTLDTLSYTSSTFANINAVPDVQFINNSYYKDTLNWMYIEQTYVANGTENFITIGNFFDNSLTNIQYVGYGSPPAYNEGVYYYIDSVIVQKYKDTKPRAIKSSLICLKDSVVLGNNADLFGSYLWLPAAGLSCTNCPNPKASPSTSTTYTVSKYGCNKLVNDTVTIFVADCATAQPFFPNVLTPNEDGANDSWHIDLKGATNISWYIYNRWGNLIRQSTINTQTYVNWDGTTATGEKCPDGIYYYVVEYNNSKGEPVNKNGYVSLFR